MDRAGVSAFSRAALDFSWQQADLHGIWHGCDSTSAGRKGADALCVTGWVERYQGGRAA